MSAAGAKAERKAGLADRRVATAVLALVILLFTPIGAKMSLERAVDRVEEQFSAGVEGRGAVADFLEDAQQSALGLITVGAKYPEAGGETDSLRAGREALLDRVERSGIAECARVNADMVESFAALRDKLLGLELSEADAESLELYSAQFDGAEGAIGHSGYNEAVARFVADTYQRFPANIIGSVLGVDPPETFE